MLDAGAIEGFRGPHHFLSTFYPHPMRWAGCEAPTLEHHYQAAKEDSPGYQRKVYAAPSPGQAKRTGMLANLPHAWDSQYRYIVMESLLRAKFSDPTLRRMLAETGDALLVEQNNWHDQVWGDCLCPKHRLFPGLNALGRMLMTLRSEIQAVPTDWYPRVALTGHRPGDFTEEQARWVRRTLAEVVDVLVADHGMRVAISGMALGSDTWWAQAALEAGVPLWAYVPFERQAEGWRVEDQDQWLDLRRRASREVCLSNGADKRLFHCRNGLMVRDASLVVAVHREDKHGGGTVATIRTARRVGVPMLRLNVSRREVSWVPVGRERSAAEIGNANLY